MGSRWEEGELKWEVVNRLEEMVGEEEVVGECHQMGVEGEVGDFHQVRMNQ